MPAARGYFGVGVEGVSKAMNFGAVMRTAHAFNASFLFTVDRAPLLRETRSADTSRADLHVPYYDWPDYEAMRLPKGCELVAVELTDAATELPEFRHPLRAAYLLGPEKGSVSAEALARADHVVKIPTRFCINLGLAAALVVYDRTLSLGGYPVRPLQAAPIPGSSVWEKLQKLP